MKAAHSVECAGAALDQPAPPATLRGDAARGGRLKHLCEESCGLRRKSFSIVQETSGRPTQLAVITRQQPIHCCGYFGQVITDFQPVSGGQDNNGQPSPLQVLLIPETLIGGDQGVELPFRGSEQLTVLEIRPAHFERGGNLV